MNIRYGTRGSALALAQSRQFADLLARRHPGLEAERVIIETSGDRFSLARPDVPSVGGVENVKAMFVKEIEDALLAGTIDFAVHSSKDLPGELPTGLVVAAFPEREDPRDAYIGGASAPRREDVKAGTRVATASLRRRIQLRLSAPGVSFVAMRGNVDTRLRKLSEGHADGLVLAKAGLKRLGRDSVPHQALPADVVIPAPGQGALAIEAKTDRQDVRDLLAPLDHAPTRLEVECERAFLAMLGGGCRTPLGAFAEHVPGGLRFRWFWSDDAGRDPRSGSFECPADFAVFEPQAREIARSLSRHG